MLVYCYIPCTLVHTFHCQQPLLAQKSQLDPEINGKDLCQTGVSVV
jgi:hypothetical protein